MAESDDGIIDAAKHRFFRSIMILSLAVFITVLSIAVTSDSSDGYSLNFSVDDIWYGTDGGDTVAVTSVDCTGDVVIPNTVEYKSKVYSVVSIDSTAFYTCVGLTSLSVPANITELDQSYFVNCSKLTAINVSTGNPNYSSYGGVVFDKHYLSLLIFPKGKGSTYSVPDGTLSIGDYAFKECSKLVSVTLPDSVYTLGKGAFEGCESLQTVSLSKSLCDMPERAFYRCTALTSIVIPDMVSSIQTDSFMNCTALSVITVGANLTYVADGVFKRCEKLATVNNGSLYISITAGSTSHGHIAAYAKTVNGENVEKTYGNYTYKCNTFTANAMLKSYTGEESDIIIDSVLIDDVYYKIIIIGSEAFKGNLAVKTVTTSDGVYHIDTKAFYGCTGLTTVFLSDTIYRIGASAFEKCSSLTEVTLPRDLHTINEGAFRECTSLTKICFNSISCSLGEDVFGKAGIDSTGIEMTYSDTVYNISSHNISDTEMAPKVTSLTIGHNVISIEDRTFRYFTYLTDLTFNSYYITGFGEDAKPFYGAGSSDSGMNVKFGSSVAKVPDYMFYASSDTDAVKISGVQFGAEMTSIGSGAFSRCLRLTELSIPSTIVSVGDYAFYNCIETVYLTLTEGLTTIGEYAFSGCTSLSSITIPDTVTTVSDYAFTGCSAANELNIGTGAQYIGIQAFSGLSKIKSISIGENVTHIGKNAFSKCSLVSAIVYNAKACESMNYSVFDESGFNTFGISVTIGESVEYVPSYLFYMPSPYIVKVEFKEGAETIQSNAFQGSHKLVSLTLPGTLTEIESGAFRNCDLLNTVAIPDSVKTIGDEAFYNCSNLNTVQLGTGLETICKNAFCGTAVIALTIPDKVTTIGNYAFSNISGLRTVTIGKGVTSIGKRAFAECSSLVTINFNAVDCGSFYNLEIFADSGSSSTTVTFGDDTVYIPEHFCDGTLGSDYRLNVSSVTIGNSVITIRDYAFYNMTNLTTLKFGDNVEVIGEYAFKGCTNLTSVAMDDKVTRIGDSAFSGCSSLNSLTFSSSLTTIGNESFNGCSSLTELNIPDSVLVIGDYAFYGCDDIVEFRLSVNLITLGSRAFYNCSGIRSVTIPGTLKKISSYAFGGCDNLGSITLEYGITYIGTYAFTGCKSLSEFYIPSSVTVIENNILYGCSALKSVIVPDSVTDFGVRPFSGVIFYDVDGKTVISDPKLIAGYRYDGTNSKLIRSTDVPVIRWMISEDEILEIDASQEYGSIPVYDGLRPFKDNDDTYSYIFKGWSPEVSIVTGSTDYTAVFEQVPLMYYVTYYYDGERYGNIDYYDIGTDVTVRDLPEKTGYTVAEWSSDDVTISDGKFAMPDKYVYIYTTSTVNKYTITFDSDGGTAVADIVKDYQSDITPPQDPKKIGYTFVKWDPEIPETMPASDMTVKAIWSINQYTITFDTDGGSEIASITQDYKSIVIMTEIPVKAGYTFTEWDPEIPETMPALNMTVKAVWSANSYTITFDTDGGTPIEPITQEVYTPISFSGVTERTGYVFSGWDPVIPDIMPVGGLTVKAQWTLGQFTITFDSAGGSAVEPLTFYYESAVIPPVDPVKDGYTFVDWSPSLPETMPGNDISVVAVWSVNQYTIIFDTDGGTAVPSITQDYKSVIETTVYTEKEGYTFVRWEPSIPDTMPLNGITVKAEWKINQYTVSFDTLGGSSVESITQDYNTKLTKPDPPVKEGYRFTGWDPEMPSKMPAADTELTAKWVAIEYTIVFDTVGGSPVESIKQGYGTAVKVPDDPVKQGYTFIGWDKEIPDTMPIDGDRITAIWSVNEYTLYFDYNDGSPVFSVTQDFGTKLYINDPQRVGYRFLGWSPAIPKVMNDSGTTYVAQWLLETYCITFDTDGGSAVSPIYCHYGAAITISPEDPVRAGYTFLGWDPEIPSVMPLGGCTVKALWAPNQYTITFDTDGGSYIAPITEYCDAEITAPANPTKDGYLFTGWSPELPEKMTPYDLTVKAQWQRLFAQSDIVKEGTTKKVSTDSTSALLPRTVVNSLITESEYVEMGINGANVKMTADSFKRVAGYRSVTVSVGYCTGVTQEKILEKLTEEQKVIASRARVIEVDFKSSGTTSNLGTIEVTFDYTVPEGKTVDDIRVYCVSGDELEKLNFTYSEGKITFYVSHLSSFAVCDGLLKDEPVIYTGMDPMTAAIAIVVIFLMLALIAVFKD